MSKTRERNLPTAIIALFIFVQLIGSGFAQNGWQKQVTLDVHLNAIQMIENGEGELVGYAAGNRNYVAKLTNSGSVWTPVPPPDSAFVFYGLHFLTSELGWVVGSKGAIYQTTNGGTSWEYRNRDAARGTKYTNDVLLACAFYPGSGSALIDRSPPLRSVESLIG